MITLAEDNPTPGHPAPSPVGFDNVPAAESPIELKVQGQIPSWVQGVMYRSGNHNMKKKSLLNPLLSNKQWCITFFYSLRVWKIQHSS